MIGTRAERLSFSPTLACVDCRRETTQGLIYQMGPQVWQLLPLCDEHIEESSGNDEPISLNALRSRINKQLAVIQHLQRRRLRIARAYMGLRRQQAHAKAQRALRWKLKQAYRLQAEAMEVQR